MGTRCKDERQLEIVLVARIASFVALCNLVTRLCLVTQCKRGSASPKYILRL